MMHTFQKLFAYNAWANREVLASLDRMTPPPARALRFMCHVVAAERLWYARLMHESTIGFVVWPELVLDACREDAETVAQLWEKYLGELTTEMLLHSISYVNTKGEEWRNSASDILMHVIIHSGYHRGQVAADIRSSGGEPAYTDYIHAFRQGLIELQNSNAAGR